MRAVGVARASTGASAHRLTYGDVRPLRSGAELFTVVAAGAAQTAERVDAEDSTSSDDELEDLAAEVRRFETLMDKQSAAPGLVPSFEAIPTEVAKLDRMPLELALKHRTLRKEGEIDLLVQQKQNQEQRAKARAAAAARGAQEVDADSRIVDEFVTTGA